MTPTKEQLDRYAALIVAGEDHEDASLVIWGDEPAEPAPEPKRPHVMVTEFPDGIVIGWDTCSILNGGCGQTVRVCKCKTGPHSLKVFEQWQTGERQRPDYAATSAAGISTTVTSATEPTTPVAAPVSAAPGEVPCSLGQHLVPLADAEKNDDGTYSCFNCQEASSAAAND